MPSTLRWRYGDTNPVMLPVDSTTVIEIGDLIYLDTDDAKPASSQADGGTLALNQEGLHDKFVGIAMQASASGDTKEIRIATSGVFEMDCAEATFELGALIGAVEIGAGTALEDQKVVTVATANLAIGRCAKRVNPAGTSVLVDIVSTVLKGGPQAMA